MTSINYNILKWARQSAGLTKDESVVKLVIKDNKDITAIEKLSKYEEGKLIPSRTTIKRMASIYRKPLLTFYLKEIPKQSNTGEDYRLHPDKNSIKENSIVKNLVSDIKAKQEIVKQLLIEEDEAKNLDFIGSLNLDTSIDDAANLISKKIKFNKNKFRIQNTHIDSFKYLRRIIQEQGIFVILASNLGSHHTDLPVNAFRGFVLSDNICPFVVINNKDSKSSWSFTIMHEVVHLFLGVTGITGQMTNETKIEKFCNDVANRMLISNYEVEELSYYVENKTLLMDKLSDCYTDYKISYSHIVYCLYKLDFITKPMWRELSSYYQKKWLQNKIIEKRKHSDSTGGPNFYRLKNYYLGAPLVKLMHRMSKSGSITPTKAAVVLGVKALKVNNFFNANIKKVG